MQTDGGSLSNALAAFDRLNATDPNVVPVNDEFRPKELLYSERMSEWLHRLHSSPSEHLQLAVRAQHIQRWSMPRSDYPDGRTGYKTWRTECAKMHARVAGEIMAAHGYDSSDVERVRFLLQKKKLKVDPEVQALEDVACLVFLEHYFEDFSEKRSDEALIAIVGKTWAKMSERGREAALTLALGERASRLVAEALAE